MFILTNSVLTVRLERTVSALNSRVILCLSTEYRRTYFNVDIGLRIMAFICYAYDFLNI